MKPAEQIAEKLWEKYAIDELIDRDKFLAALREYGAAVRQGAAGVCAAQEKSTDKCDNGVFLCSQTKVAVRDCAEAIERMELP